MPALLFNDFFTGSGINLKYYFSKTLVSGMLN
jgi:hypothetical protein